MSSGVIRFLAVVGIAAAATFLLERLRSKENWGIRTSDAFYPGFGSQKEAKKYAKRKGWSEANIARLADKEKEKN